MMRKIKLTRANKSITRKHLHLIITVKGLLGIAHKKLESWY